MHIKIHKSYRNVIAIADTNIIGKIFEEGKLQLNVRENFYKERKVSKEELIKIIKLQTMEDATFNLVGEETIQIALKSGIITEENVGKVAGIPFALTLI